VLLKKDRDRGGTASHTGLEYCNRLFEIERTLKLASAEERYKARLEQSSPLLDEFHKWLTDQAAMALPKSSIGTALTYCLNQWPKLTAFLKDGRLELDNNRSERSIKPFVIGRKNWLFSNTPKGASSSAVVYSIVETAKENGLDPSGYLTHLFETLPNTNMESPSVLETLMPWSKSLPSSCRLPAQPTAILNNK
jgi:transposase